jgi:cell division protein FtsI/penicillin-binding protein 2
MIMKGHCMKFLRLTSLLVVGMIFLAACDRSTATPEMPTPQVQTTPAPSVEAAITAYLDAYVLEDYASMYNLLSNESQVSVSLEDFSKKHQDAINAMSCNQVEYAIRQILTNPGTAQATYSLTYKTILFGDIANDFNLSMVLEEGGWRVKWTDGLILPELEGGKVLVTYYDPPARGNIYDRNGAGIAVEADAYALGMVAGSIDGVPQVNFRDMYYGYTAGDYVPVGEALAEDVENSGILNFGVYAVPYTSRFYTPGAAAQAVGHLQYITTEELDTFRQLGYSGAERVGRSGIELWGEDTLRGKSGATLYIAAADKTPEDVLKQADGLPSSSLTLTMDADLQAQAQAAMDGLPGAIVVMEVDTGRVLAMVSSPAADTNWYDPKNYNFSTLGSVLSIPNIELNRATQGQYPLGSVFKIVTMAAALESGLFAPDTVYNCPYFYTEISGITLQDWTWQRCEDEKLQTGRDTCSGASSQPSGDLTLVEGLMRSCDPWFYHIGYTLYNAGQTTAISDMSTGFGLGELTGIEQVEEEPGVTPIPTDGLNATSLAIGQGNMLVTPLQVANFIAAIANGGTLFRPQLVENFLPAFDDPIQVFKPEALSTLPIKEETLAAIQEGMRLVTKNPRGTAYARLGNFAIPTAGKTGTAESGTVDPQAWFAGYSLAGMPDMPDIAVVVLVEKQGEGSIWALPIFRGVMEIYFFGSRQTLYPWETNFGVINPEYGVIIPATPTPEP